ncbi:6891_t:CDS:10 [Paraglomus occultum]|uniref:6891_t:CDS:1 n=1 Tax=Paraglomus occultum TaxID=144539 RepID=A0A9N9AM79_9GLOM|nr:6891_t:CDS:10 [Paraglomus occultum]
MAADGSRKYSNRLKDEKSPYLLQHADNPVDWYPWGEEAFEKAKRDNMPIFLSAHESFENEEIAKTMNEYFVNIKGVDNVYIFIGNIIIREVNPDVDQIYMTFVQATAGSGGWPMSVFLTPELYPIFGGTYFPPEDKGGRPGFHSLLRRIAQLWREQPDALRRSGESVISQLRDSISMVEGGSTSHLTIQAAHKCYKHFARTFDAVEGGFGGAPKFPTPVQFHFLLRYAYYMQQSLSHVQISYDSMTVSEIRNRGEQLGVDFKGCIEKSEFVDKLKSTVQARKEDADKAIDMVKFTLKKIARGGIHDHVGNGFHRYSTDRYWHVPHFEKMLYDQAQLLATYSDVYLITKEDYFADIARDIVKYVERDLRDAENGGFYSAEDADSYPYDGAPHKLEGAFAVWEESEIYNILGRDHAQLFCYYFGVKPSGNVDPASDIQGELTDKNVLIEKHTVEEAAEKFNLTPDEVNQILSTSKERLFKYRVENRSKPHRDDKVLTAWNGLMISGLSRAYDAIGDKRYLDLAESAVTFLRKNMYHTERKVLLRSYREGPGSVNGFVDDYSFLIQGLLDLYESTFNEEYLSWAVELQDKQDELFYDNEGKGGYFNVPSGEKNVLLRMKNEHDGAEPSPNSVTVSNLIRLAGLVMDSDYNERAESTLKSFIKLLEKYPYSIPTMVSALMMNLEGTKQIVLVGPLRDALIQQFDQKVKSHFIPNRVMMHATPESKLLSTRNDVVSSILQSAAGSDPEKENEPAPAIHICENFTCGMPIISVDELAKKLEQYNTSETAENTYVVYNANVYTVDYASKQKADTFVVRNGVFLDVGMKDEILEKWKLVDKRIDAGGKTILPGIIDAHVHIMYLGQLLTSVDLTGTKSIEGKCSSFTEARSRVKAYILSHKDNLNESSWIRGFGWDQMHWEPKEFPHWKDLSDLGTPFTCHMLLTRIDGHVVWVNEKVMNILSDMPECIEGGEIVRDKETNEKTGIFVDNAMEFVIRRAPPLSETEKLTQLRAAISHIHSVGLTGVHDASVPLGDISFFKEYISSTYCYLRRPVRSFLHDDFLLFHHFYNSVIARNPDDFNIRNYAMVESPQINEYCGDKVDMIIGYGKGRLTVRSVKLFMDGALGSWGAAMLEPYCDDPTKTGLLLSNPDSLHDVMQKWVSKGFQINTHCIGDRANKIIIDAYEKVFKTLALKGAADLSDEILEQETRRIGKALRFRIEHAQILTLDDIRRAAKLGIIPSMQPTHATSDMSYAEERIGKERVKGAYAWRSFLDAGVTAFPLSSDFPVEAANPFLGFYAAITRKWTDGNSPHGKQGWFPEQKLTREEALRGFTIDAAYAAFAEDVLGSISKGKYADFVVIDRDIMQVPEKDIIETRVIATVFGGNVVYGEL